MTRSRPRSSLSAFRDPYRLPRRANGGAFFGSLLQLCGTKNAAQAGVVLARTASLTAPGDGHSLTPAATSKINQP